MANNQKRNSICETGVSRRNSQRSYNRKDSDSQQSRSSFQDQVKEDRSPSPKRQKTTPISPPLTPGRQTPTYAAAAAAAAAKPPLYRSTSYFQSHKRYSASLPGISNLQLSNVDRRNSVQWPSRHTRAAAKPRPASIAEEPEDYQSNSNWSVQPFPRPNSARNAHPRRSSSYTRSRVSRPSRSNSFCVGDNFKLQGYAAQTGPFPPGSIIRVPHFEQYGTTSYSEDYRYTLEAKAFGEVCAKWRRMIVVTVHKGHYVCLPIYTFNGQGISPETCGNHRDPEEYVSISDYRVEEPNHNTTPYEGLKTKYFKNDVWTLHPGAVVSLTYPISRRNDCTAITEGRLRLSSTRSLLRLYMKQTMRNIGMWIGDLVQSETGSEPIFINERDEDFRVSDLFAKEIARAERFK